MRIAYVCADPGVPVFGRKGCSIHVQEVIRAFRLEGARIELFATRMGGSPPRDFDGLAHALPAPDRLPSASRERASLAANRALRAALASRGRFDLVYERYSLWSHAAIDAAARQGTPALLEVNAPLIDEQATHRGLVDRENAQRVADRVFDAATALVAVSNGVAEYLVGQGVPPSRVRVISNGVDTGRFGPHVSPAWPSGPRTFTVGFVGTLKPWHGLATLVESFHRVRRAMPEARLLVVGDGPERAGLEAQIAKRGLTGAVRLTGAVDPAEVPGWVASMDVAVAPYPPLGDFYFSPLKVYEYMAGGVPVVASRIGELSALIRDRFTGYLCAPGDAAAFAEAIIAIGRDDVLRDVMGRAARATICERHTWRAVARRLLALVPHPTLERGRVA